jgi:type III pantothenate kinase
MDRDYIGLVDGILDRIVAELASTQPGTKPRVIASGGLAHIIAPDSRHIAEIDDVLTLDGLRILFDRNKAAKPRSRPH